MPTDRCRHCRTPIPAGAGTEPFCCRGCEAVYALLMERGLGRYYELAGDQVAPAPLPAAGPAGAAPRAWLEPLLEGAGAAPGELCELRLDVQGIHCSACVWLMQELFRRRAGAAEITVNPALGQATLRYARGAFDPEAWVRDVEAFGYRFGPPRKRPTRASRELPLRLGISAALAINLMLFSVSFYFGLAPEEGELFRLFSWLSLALATGVVAVGGWPFFRSSLQGLRRGVAHLDLPIAAGIALVYLSSLVEMRDGRGDLAYFDTLAIFITLMLTGRLLQERLLERNRRFLLEDDGVQGLLVRRIEADRVAVRPAAAVREGDRLLVAPGELLPVDATLDEGGATVSTDWINGEPAPRELAAGGRVLAGSFNAGGAAFTARAATDFDASPLVALLGAAATRSAAGPHGRLWQRLARWWVAGVVAVAAAGFALWLPAGGDRALSVAAAILVVTCPCAIGIAVPLAYELTFHALRRRGAYVRGFDLLDRLPRVRRVVFDKTGTLTLGELELARPEAIAALSATERDAAYNLAVRSAHPASRALAAALAAAGARFAPADEVSELPGRGVEWRRADGVWRLGAGEWAAGIAGDAPVLARDGRLVARFELGERLRPDAAREVAELARRGHEIWLLSGDEPRRVAALAARLGVPAERALGGLSPEAKAARLDALDRDDTLYLGDGVNDAPAFARAFAAGTPAVDRPVMPGRSDFFLVGEGLSPLAALLDGAARLARVTRRLIVLAVVYNAGVVAAALAGWVSPLVAAVVMPASTLTLVTATALGLRDRAALPAAPAAPAAGAAAAGRRLAEAAP